MVGVVLSDNFHMGPNGDLDLAAQPVLMHAAYRFCIGPPTSVHMHRYGVQLREHFHRAIQNSIQLSRTADDAGLGRGKSDFDEGENGEQFCFRLPIFEERVSLCLTARLIPSNEASNQGIAARPVVYFTSKYCYQYRVTLLVWAYERQQLQLYPIASILQEQMQSIIRRESAALASQNTRYCFPPGRLLNFPDFITLPGSLVEVEFYMSAHMRGGGLKWEVKQITVLE